MLNTKNSFSAKEMKDAEKLAEMIRSMSKENRLLIVGFITGIKAGEQKKSA